MEMEVIESRLARLETNSEHQTQLLLDIKGRLENFDNRCDHRFHGLKDVGHGNAQRITALESKVSLIQWAGLVFATALGGIVAWWRGS